MCCRWPITKRSLESGRHYPVTFRFYSFNNTGSNGPDRRGFRGSAAGNGLDLSVNGGLILAPGGDADLDGLSNEDEIGIYFTDPLDADTDDDGLNDGEEVALATDPNNPDHDGDTICDGSGTGGGSCTAGPDNCPFISNLSQTNSDALEAGDDCQCGDVNRDNTVTVLDLVIVRQNLVGAALSGSFDASRCDFDGDPGCGVDDAFVLDRTLKGAPTSLVDACPAFGSPLR